MKACVVVIEDEREVLQLLLDVLRMGGFQPVGCDRPEDVDALSRATQPDVFLIDIMLPGTSGIEVAEHLRAAGYEATPMIALSASRRMLDVAGQSHLFQETIAKPFEMSELLDRLERWVKR